jgi:hypothetical protein
MRVPILMGVILVALPVLGLTGLRRLLQNLFVLDVEGTVWTTTIAFALCWSILLTSRLVRLNGDRFGLPQALNRNTLNLGSVWWICCLALPLILAQFLERCEFALDRGAILWRAGSVLLGFVIAYLLAFAGLFLTVLVAPPGTAPANKAFPAPKWLEKTLGFAHSHGVPQFWADKLGARLKHLPEGLRIGYFDPDTGLLWAGHWLAFTFAVCIGAITLALDVYRRVLRREVTVAELELDTGVSSVSAGSLSRAIVGAAGAVLCGWRPFAVVGSLLLLAIRNTDRNDQPGGSSAGTAESRETDHPCSDGRWRHPGRGLDHASVVRLTKIIY